MLAELIALSDVQMQFYLLCPLLMLCLRPAAQKGLERRLAKASGAIIAAVTAYRAVIALDFQLPVPVFGPLDHPEALELMTRTLKVSPCVASPRPWLRCSVSPFTCSQGKMQGRRPCAMHQEGDTAITWIHYCVALSSALPQVSYYSLLPRLTHLAFGMLGACAIRSPGTTHFLVGRRMAHCLCMTSWDPADFTRQARPHLCSLAVVPSLKYCEGFMHAQRVRKKVTGGLSALAAALLCAALLSNRYGPEPVKGHPLNSPAAKVIGVAGITGLLQPAALTLLLCCAVMGVSQRVTRALAWTGWRRVADVSYDMYLIHPMMMYAVWTLLPPSAWFDVQKPSALKFLAVSAIVIWCSLGLAKVHHRVCFRLL